MPLHAQNLATQGLATRLTAKSTGGEICLDRSRELDSSVNENETTGGKVGQPSKKG